MTLDQRPTPQTDAARNYRADVKARNARLIDLAERLERQRDAAVEALENIADPISALKRSMQAGDVLNGQMAYQLSNDPEHLKGIARATLAEIKGEG